MKVITAMCFIFSGSAIILIQTGFPSRLKSLLAKALAAIISVVSMITVADYLYVMASGHEVTLTETPVINLFLLPVNRMAFLTSCIFLLIGCTLFLLSGKNHRADSIAHVLIFLSTLASYFVPVSYIFNVYTVTGLLNIPVALSTGIALFALCTAIFMIRPGTWLMKVFTSKSTGGIMARKLLPGLMVLPVIIGLLRIYGEHAGLYTSEVGVTLVAITYVGCFIFLVWLTARSVNRIDEKRILYEEALLKSREELEIKVEEKNI